MHCCFNCLGDTYLEREIVPAIGQGPGICDYCGGSADVLVDPTALQDRFELLLDAYKTDVDGEELRVLLNRDWGILPPTHISSDNSSSLLADILGRSVAMTERYKPRLIDGTAPLEQWQAFRFELMRKNRYFPESIAELPNLVQLLEHLRADDGSFARTMFRARTYDRIPHAAVDMGAPPAHLCTHGRANPVGIPFLYLASDRDTAASEVRPHTGDGVCIAEFVLADGLRLADLRDPRTSISPFAMEDEIQFSLLYRARPLLVELGEELTRPIGPRTAPIEYLPTQYLCEFIKMSGFDGVMYRSSVGPGINVALFDVDKANVGAVTQYRVAKVNVQVEEV